MATTRLKPGSLYGYEPEIRGSYYEILDGYDDELGLVILAIDNCITSAIEHFAYRGSYGTSYLQNRFLFSNISSSWKTNVSLEDYYYSDSFEILPGSLFFVVSEADFFSFASRVLFGDESVKNQEKLKNFLQKHLNTPIHSEVIKSEPKQLERLKSFYESYYEDLRVVRGVVSSKTEKSLVYLLIQEETENVLCSNGKQFQEFVK